MADGAEPGQEAGGVDPRAELRELVEQARSLVDLERLFGCDAALLPRLDPLPRALGPALASAPAATSPSRAAPSPVAAPGPTAAAAPGPTAAAEPRPPAPAPTAAAEPRPPAPAPAAPPPPRADASAAPPAVDLAARRAANEAQLHALARRITGCTRCRLSEGRTQLVFGQGDAAAELVFVGEGPGYHEDQQGLAFVGNAGELLTKMIEAMGLARDDVFICNVVKCRPPGNRTPAPDEMATCLPILEEQLAIIRPRVICALGKTAGVGLGLLRPEQALGRARGTFLDWRGTPTLLTYHPAYLLRNPADKRKAWEDLQKIFPLLERRRT